MKLVGIPAHSSREQMWRIRDVFLVLFVYGALLLAFLYAEVLVLGTHALEDTPGNPLIFLLEEIVEGIFLATLPVLVVTRWYRANLRDIGIVLDEPGRSLWWGIAGGVLLWASISLLDLALGRLVGEPTPHPYMLFLEKLQSGAGRAVLLVAIAILGPASEEIFYRGFAYTVFRRRYGTLVGVIASSVLFTGMHFSISRGLQIFMFGMGLAGLYEWRRRTLITPIAAHTVINLLSVYVGGR